jgi:hypothetical protein
MDTTQILTRLDEEIARLQQVRALLTGESTKRKPGRPSTQAAKVALPAKKRTMSAEGRARIAAAQRARWAKAKKAA